MSTFLSNFAERLALEFKKREQTVNKGKANGYASLDSSGTVPLEQLNIQKITAPRASVNTLLSSNVAYKDKSFQVSITTFNLTADDTIELISKNGVVVKLTNITYDVVNQTVIGTAIITNDEKLYTVVFKRYGQLNPTLTQIDIVDRTWVDLRSGNTLPTIRTRNVHTIQTAQGVYFTENSPAGYTGPTKTDAGWGEWVKFEDLIWKRSDNKTLEVIMHFDTNASSTTFMFGIGSTTTNESSSTQYWQGEQLMYMNSYDVKQYYGGGGISSWSYDIPHSFSAAGYYKFKWLNNGQTVHMYYVNNSANWLDESQLVKTFTIPTNRSNPANSQNLLLMLNTPSPTIDSKLTAYRVY